MPRSRHSFVDLSGLAKGYAVDALAERLLARGFEDFLVDIGGDLYARGRPEPGRRWRIGIEDPAGTAAGPREALALENRAVATSGDYRNFFVHEGTRYAHLIDPRTGRPIAHRLASVTVIDARSARADAYATALMVLGPEAGPAAADRLGVPALFLVGTEAGFEHRASEALRESGVLLDRNRGSRPPSG